MLRPLVFICALLPLPALGQMIDDLTDPPAERWEYFSDQVMGGVSQGLVQVLPQENGHVLRLTGAVSTENRGGFIQMRHKLQQRLPKEARGLRLKVRGNDQGYFVHLRTTGTVLPWQYYQAGFAAGPNWQQVEIPFSAFAAGGGAPGRAIDPTKIKSVAVVAYGRDHQADVSLAALSYY